MVKALRVLPIMTPNFLQASLSIASMPVPHLEMTFKRGEQASITRGL